MLSLTAPGTTQLILWRAFESSCRAPHPVPSAGQMMLSQGRTGTKRGTLTLAQPKASSSSAPGARRRRLLVELPPAAAELVGAAPGGGSFPGGIPATAWLMSVALPCGAWVEPLWAVSTGSWGAFGVAGAALKGVLLSVAFWFMSFNFWFLWLNFFFLFFGLGPLFPPLSL